MIAALGQKTGDSETKRSQKTKEDRQHDEVIVSFPDDFV
jgi:hypothetical protein